MEINAKSLRLISLAGFWLHKPTEKVRYVHKDQNRFMALPENYNRDNWIWFGKEPHRGQ